MKVWDIPPNEQEVKYLLAKYGYNHVRRELAAKLRGQETTSYYATIAQSIAAAEGIIRQRMNEPGSSLSRAACKVIDNRYNYFER